MKKKATPIIIVLLLLAAGAVLYFSLKGKKAPVVAEPPVQYVSDIISGIDSDSHKLISEYDPADSKKAIFIFGSKSRTSDIAQA